MCEPVVHAANNPHITAVSQIFADTLTSRCSRGPKYIIVTTVNAARAQRRYLLLIEHGDAQMTTTINTRLASLALAAALLLPGALAALNQAAQIVA